MKNTKEKILETAEELIQNVGLNAMSYKHISDIVGIRKASIHHHFPKKQDLVNELLEKCHISYGSQYRSIVEGPGSAPEKLKLIAGVFLTGLEKNQLCMVGAMSSDLNTLEKDSCKKLEATIKSTVSTYSKAFEQGREEKSLRVSGSDEDAAFSFFSFLLGAQMAARANGGSEQFKSATEVILNIWTI